MMGAWWHGSKDGVFWHGKGNPVHWRFSDAQAADLWLMLEAFT